MSDEKKVCSTMGKWTIIAVVLVLAVGVLSWATMEQRKSIAQTLTELGDCSTFAECIDKAGLTGILEKDGPFTIFVPNNEAFKQVPEKDLKKLLDDKSALTAVLLYHMVPKNLTVSEMGQIEDCMTCTVPQSAIACGTDSFGKGKCVKSEIPCRNGYIYIIDAVQFPPFLNNAANKAANNTTAAVEEITVTEEVAEPASSDSAASKTADKPADKPAEDKKAEKPAEKQADQPSEEKPAAEKPSA